MAGYPGRHSYDQFYKRYRLLVPSAGAGASDAQTATKELVAALKLGEGQFQFGLTKLFLKGGEVTRPHPPLAPMPPASPQILRVSCAVCAPCVVSCVSYA